MVGYPGYPVNRMHLHHKKHSTNQYLILVLLCAIFMFVPQACGFERKLLAQINPGCSRVCNQSDPITVVYIRATGPNDTLHYLWDFEGKPSILFALTLHTANLSIDWPTFLWEEKKSVTFSEEPSYTFGLVLNRILEYNDVNNTGFLDVSQLNSSSVRELDTKDFLWKRTAFLQDEANVVLSMEGTHPTRRGKVRIMVNDYGFSEHSENVPHLLHSANTSLVELEIDGLETEASFVNSRFAMEFLLASSDPVDKAMTINVRESLNDEQCPGVFTLVDLLTPSCRSDQGGGYLQWRPVAYIARTRSLANSTETNSYGVSPVDDAPTSLNNTLLQAYYSDDLVDSILVQKTIVSFGLKDDGFYKKTNYTSWAFTIGYGHPPDENFSLLVILVISIGLGLPAVLIVISAIVFGVRRCTRKKDELCLSR